MRQLVQEPVGIELSEVSVPELSAADLHRVQDLLAQHGVVILRNQRLDDDGFVDFLRRFGPLTTTAGEPTLPGFADLNLISNEGRSTPPRSNFHVDTSYVRRPPAYTALRAVQIPRHGGQTLFSNQYRAFATLPTGLKRLLAGRTVRHVVTGVDPGPDQERFADHPVFRAHPLSGQIALYLSTPQRCVSISGFDPMRSAELIGQLFAHSTQADNVYRHTWLPGDVVMWDNGCVMHRADHDGVIGTRTMHRGMVGDYQRTGAPCVTR